MHVMQLVRGKRAWWWDGGAENGGSLGSQGELWCFNRHWDVMETNWPHRDPGLNAGSMSSELWNREALCGEINLSGHVSLPLKYILTSELC